MQAFKESIEQMRARVTNVRYAPIGHDGADILFSFNGRPMSAQLAGRNVDLVLALDDSDADKAIAVRTMLDGDATRLDQLD